MNYKPKSIDTSDVVLPEGILELADQLSKNIHEVWAVQRLSEGWSYGTERSDKKKQHPCLVEYDELPENEKLYDRNTAMATLKFIIKLGYKIEKQ